MKTIQYIRTLRNMRDKTKSRIKCRFKTINYKLYTINYRL